MNSNIKFTSLGSNQLKVSRVGLGCMGMSEFYGATSDQESIKTIQRAYELGVNHFDTADIYGRGHNEQLLGRAIKNVPRDKVVIATKCGFTRNRDTGEIDKLNCTPQHIKKACDDSLKRLNVDYIDLFYLHRQDPNTPIEVSMSALADLVKDGKVLNIGLSSVSPETINKAHAIHPLTAVQSEYSIITRDAEKDVLPLCKELGIGFVAYCPLGNGFLTGKLTSLDTLEPNDFRRVIPRLQHENISYNLNIVKTISNMALKKGCTPVQISLAWLLAQGDNIVAIPGTKRISYLEENSHSFDVQLSNEELLLLSNEIPFGYAKGKRLPEEISRFLNNYEIA